jgi:hypothetical protein
MFTFAFCAAFLAAEPTAREVAEQYLAAALAEKPDDAVKLAVAGQSPSRVKTAEEVKKVVGTASLPMPTVVASVAKKEAIAVTGPFKMPKANADGNDVGVLVLTLKQTDDGWRVKDIDFRTETRAKEVVAAFKKANADAAEIPAKK